MKQIYKPVLEQLKTNVPELKWIDLDTDQLSSSQRPKVAFPCALIGIELPGCQSLSDTDQKCNALVTVKLAFDTMGATNSAAEETIQNKSLEVYDIIEKVHNMLQGFETADFEPLSRTRQGKVPSRNGLFQYQIVYSTITE